MFQPTIPIEQTKDVTRVEVIDSSGRAYTNYSCTNVMIDFQDNNRTVKVFLNNKIPTE